MPVSERELRQQIVETGRLVYQKGWVAANDGNISARLSADRMLATPTGISKGMMHEDDLIICDMKGNKVEGDRDRTTEIAMHVAIYELRPDIHAVVHAHPPVSTGFATAGRSLNLALLPEVVIGLGCVPLAQYGLPGTPALTDSLKPYIPRYDALLMANHGAVCYAESVQRAYFKMETLEHTARITLVAELLGGPNVLPRKEVQALIDSRGRYGVARPGGSEEPGCPIAAEDVGGGSSQKIEVTRDELIQLIDEAVQARLAGSTR